jgi:hypothetical protein
MCAVIGARLRNAVERPESDHSIVTPANKPVVDAKNPFDLTFVGAVISA